MIRAIHTYTLPLLIYFVSCSSLPESDYYESGGILSIKTSLEDAPPGWQIDQSGITHSLVYEGYSADHDPTLRFQFYLQNTGLYHLSLLTAYLSEELAERVSVTITDPDGYLAGSFVIIPPISRMPLWISRDSSGKPSSVLLDQNGMYTLRISHQASPGLLLDALHLTLNNEHPPEGSGYPETRQPDSEPLLAKREQIVGIPPSAAFGVIADTDVLNELIGTDPDLPLKSVLVRITESDPDSVRMLEHLKKSFEARKGDDADRGFVLHPAAEIHAPEFKKYPALWFTGGRTGFDELQRQIRFLSDPSLPTYEIPFFAPMPEWLTDNSDMNSAISGELLQRWVQLSMLSPVMVLPLTGAGQLTERDRADIEEAVNFRRNLFPFIYSYTLRARTSGIRTVTSAESQPGGVMYGEEFFAVPVSEPGSDRLPVRFPEGVWYSWWSGQKYEGGQTWLIDLFSNQIPLFVKAGSIIPQRVGGLPVNTGTNHSLTVDIFAGGVSSFRFYEDDGKTMDYREGEFTTTAYRWFEQEGRATFNIGAMVWGKGDDYRTNTRYLLRFRYLSIPRKVTANAELLREGTGEGQWYYDEALRSVIINWNQPSGRRTELEFEW